MNTIGENIQSLRASRKETQQQLADAIGVSRSYVMSWEANSRPIRSDDLCKLAEHYNVSADYLLGLSDVSSRNPELQAVAKYTGLSEDAINNIKQISELFDEDLLSTLLSDWNFMEIVAALGDLRECITWLKEAEKLTINPDVIAVREALKGFGRIAEVAKTTVGDERPDYIASQLMADLYVQARFQKYELADLWDDLVETVVPEVKAITRKRLKEDNND